MSRNLVKSEQFPKVPKQILINDRVSMNFGIQVSDTGVTAVNGRKIVKAGTPMTGDLVTRATAFTKATGADAKGILLHDVDVTEGPWNGVLITLGAVDLLKLDADVVALLTAAVKTALPAITFTEGRL